MNNEQYQFMTLLPNLTGWLTAQETAWALGLEEEDIPVLVRARLLKPLGSSKPSTGSVESAWAARVRELGKDEAWMARATRVIISYWSLNNGRRSNRNRGGLNGHSSGSPDPRS